MSTDSHEDDDIRLFREEYPDVYEFVLKVINGTCDDETLQAFKDKYGEDFLNDFLKILSRKASNKDIEAFELDYPDIYIAIKKLLDKHLTLQQSLSEQPATRKSIKKGDFIGQKYEVYDVLGEGGFGIVYLVYSKRDKFVYALKTIKEEYFEDINIRKRFIKETQAWINLDKNPFIVQAYFIDEISSRLFLKLEYIPPDKTGLNTLDSYLRRKPPVTQQSLLWGIQFCYGMEHAYSKGIRAHRDIKPSNIMITNDGTLKITDFGLAGIANILNSIQRRPSFTQQSVGERVYQTMEGSALGTPPYMAPEQFINSTGCDEKSDIYSFGIVLYQMVTGGRLPFCPDVPRNASSAEIFNAWYQQHCRASIPQIDSPLYPFIKKCLEKNPGKRYPSFKQLRANLESLLKEHARKSFICPQNKELDANDWNNKGLSLETIGKYEEALDCYNKAIEINPLYAEAWEAKGFILGEYLSAPNEALNCYEKAAEIKPDRASSWNCKGMGYAGLSKYEEAIKCYDRALEIDPHYVIALINKGTVFNNLIEWREAISCYDKAIEIDPLFGIAWRSKGSRLSLFQKYAEAIECYDHALKINPKDVFAWRHKGSALEKLKKYNEAAYCYTHALAINPLSNEIWYYKGILMEKIGNIEEAIRCYNQLIEIDPKDSMGWKLKIELLINTDKYEEAMYWFQQAVMTDPLPIDIWFSIGHSFMDAGMPRAAIVAFKNFVRHATSEYKQDVKKVEGIIKKLESTE